MEASAWSQISRGRDPYSGQESASTIFRRTSRLLLFAVTRAGRSARAWSLLRSNTNDHEDPLAYDRLIRRFQSATERESDGRKKGYSGILEADLLRTEAKAHAVAVAKATAGKSQGEAGLASAVHSDSTPVDREQGQAMFHEIIETRFLAGDDDEFDYSLVDQNTTYDDRGVERDQEESWFDEEQPLTVEDGSKLGGQTGVQDF